jgi:hypothetical protein
VLRERINPATLKTEFSTKQMYGVEDVISVALFEIVCIVCVHSISGNAFGGPTNPLLSVFAALDITFWGIALTLEAKVYEKR